MFIKVPFLYIVPFEVKCTYFGHNKQYEYLHKKQSFISYLAANLRGNTFFNGGIAPEEVLFKPKI